MMIEADRLISAGTTLPEDVADRAIRPKLLEEYVGQPHVRSQMEIFIKAAKLRGDALDHLLIFGPPGLAIRGVPRARRATSSAPSSLISSPIKRALRLTIY